MQCLSSLPLLLTEYYVIGSSLLSEWLPMRWVAKVDAALCHRSHREKFLQLLASKHVRLQCERTVPLRWQRKGVCFDWARIRGVRLSEIFIDHVFIRSIEKYLSAFGDSVSKLVFVYAGGTTDFTSQALTASEYCHNLTSIEIESVPITPALATLFSANRSLTSLSCCVQLDEVNLAALQRFCRGSLQKFHARGELKKKGDVDDLYYLVAMSQLRSLRLPGMCGADHSHPLYMIARNTPHLLEVRLDQIECDTVTRFAEHCPNIEAFEVTLCESVDAAVVNLITARWKSLHTLVLLHDEECLGWDDTLQSALLQLIQRCHTLTTLVCIESLPAQQIGTSEELCGLLPRPVPRSSLGPPATSQLQCLWMEVLPIDALHSVVSACPHLCEFLHGTAVNPQYTTALCAMPLKSVAFDCSFLETSPALATFSALSELRLWNLHGLEDGIVAICKHSPTLQTLSLHFKRRPNLRILPVMLKHVPGLRQLSFHAGVGEGEGDDQGFRGRLVSEGHVR